MKNLNGKQKITLVENIYRHHNVSIRQFVSRGRNIGMDIPLASELENGSGSLSLFCSDYIELVAYWADLNEVMKWAQELNINTTEVEEANY